MVLIFVSTNHNFVNFCKYFLKTMIKENYDCFTCSLAFYFFLQNSGIPSLFLTIAPLLVNPTYFSIQEQASKSYARFA